MKVKGIKMTLHGIYEHICIGIKQLPFPFVCFNMWSVDNSERKFNFEHVFAVMSYYTGALNYMDYGTM